jgi:uncharacterized membrane protein
MRNEVKITILLVLFSFIVGAYAYMMLPARMTTYWDISGMPTGAMPKAIGAFLGPDALFLLFVIFMIIPQIGSLRASIETFRPDYCRFMLGMTAVFFLIYLQAILWNLGTMISFALTLPILLGCLFFYFGVVLENAQRNWFIGVVTPRVLSSEAAWDETHKTAGHIFKVAGALAILSVLAPPYGFFIILGLLLVAVVGLIAYTHLRPVEVEKSDKRQAKRRKKRNRKA